MGQPPNLATALADSYVRHADDCAVVDRGRRLSYAELDRSTAIVARGIAAELARFAGPQVPVVAVALGPSIEFVSAVMGTVRASAAYLPIDAHSPDDYIFDVLVESRPALVITTAVRAAMLRESGHPACTLEDLRVATDGPLDSLATPASAPAYVTYTSGSTGKPKGVVVSHEALLNSTAARIRAYGVPARIPLVHSVAFDLSSGVLFWALLSGGTLIISPVPLTDVPGMLELIHREDVTHLVYPASLYASFLERAVTKPPTGLVHVMIGSERWSELLIDRHSRLLPTTSLHNEYGPTEACVWSSGACVYSGVSGKTRPLTIGSPIMNTEYHLINGDGEIFGESELATGELYISGRNVAIGYLNRPELTRGRFVLLPDGRRAYRTGDLVERTREGAYRFVGRVDRQLKVQGNRIEPGHVETVIMGHPGVEQAHVTVLRNSDASSVLAAYIVLREEAGEISSGDVRAYLATRLPSYLVPHAYLFVPDLPRTPSGKIDEGRLPPEYPAAPDGAAVSPTVFRGAEDPVEADIAAIFADILGVAQLDAHTPLTELAVTSLALVRAAAAINQTFGVEVPVSVLFAQRDISAVAESVRSGGTSDRPPLVPTSRDNVDAPLSAQQHQIWFLNQLSPGALAYNTQFSLRLSGDLKITALNAALSHIVERHEILRTTFHEGYDGPYQKVRPPWPVSVELVDLRLVVEPNRHEAMLDHMRQAMTTPFTVSELPLVRWQLYRLADASWNLFQIEHHLVHDGWSASLFLREIRDTYRSFVSGQRPDAASLSVQYRDYARWYHQWRRTADYKQQQAYWIDKLAGCPQVGVTFDPDRPRPAEQTFNGDCVRTDVPADLVAQIDDLCRAHGVTRFAVFLTAFVSQVWHHTGETDIVIGSALSNRRQAETAGLLGMFVNALPLRLTVAPGTSVGSAVRATMATLLETQDNQEFPLVDLIKKLNLPRDRARNPLFQLMFAFHDSPRPRLELDGLKGELWIDHNGSAKNDVNVVCVPNPPADGSPLSHAHAGINILWEYNTDLFDRATAERLANEFVRTVRLLAMNWHSRLEELDLNGPVATRQILSAGEGARAELPFMTLHEGVDRRIRGEPDSVAIRHNTHAYTYRDLDLMACSIEEVLRSGGIAACDVVAIGSEKSPELVAAWLAASRLGVTYVCVDPEQPSGRLSGLLGDAGATAVLCTAEHVLAFASIGVRILLLKASPPVTSSGVRSRHVSAASPAYLTYTSGSTGTPKAVVTTHLNAATAIHARTEYFGAARPRTLVTLPTIFDVAGSMVWWTLWQGGVVVLPNHGSDVRDVEVVRSLVEREQVTHVNFVASFYQHFADAVPLGAASSLEVVAIGGEPCTSDLVALHSTKLPSVSLHNEYGPTETTVWCSVACVFKPGQPAARSRINIGRPLPNYSMAVMTSPGRLAPIGAHGELYVGGDAVAIGYHARPELTAEKFVTFTSGPLAGRRFYRTGDIGRLTGSGEFELFGRLDNQVKVRGYRIEIGEIERCLSEHPDIRTAYVSVDKYGESRSLSAYVVAPGKGNGLATSLREWAASRLPAYMIPSAIAVLDQLPLTATGKVDRARLPRPADVPAFGSHSATVTPEQETLVAIWRSVLDKQDVGIDDDFFAVGGDSLQSIRVVSLARSQGLTLSVAQVLRNRTIRALAAQVEIASRQPAPVGRRANGTRLPLTPIQGWFFAQRFADPNHFNQVSLFELGGDVDMPALQQAIEWMLQRHDAFRTRFESHDGTWMGVLTDGPSSISWDLITFAVGGYDDALSRLNNAQDGIDIETGVLYQIVVCGGEATPAWWMGMAVHHLIVDAVSWDIIVRDIERGYARLRSGVPLSDDPAPGAPLAETAPGVDQSEIAYWRRLANSSKLVMTDMLKGDVRPVSERTQARRILPDLVRRFLMHDAPILHGVTARSLLLGALARAMEPMSGKLYLFLEGHGRARLDGADDVVGWFTALYPVLLSFDDHANLVDTATLIDGQIAEVPDHGINYGRARYLDTASEFGALLNEMPQPRLTFNYLGHRMPQHGVLRAGPVSPGTGIGERNVLPTPFDITVTDTGETVTVDVSYDGDIFVPDTVNTVLDRMSAELNGAASVVQLGIGTGDDKSPHVFVHAVDGTVGRYGELARRVSDRWRCFGLPQADPLSATSVRGMAVDYLARIRQRWMAGPLTLTGWSFGAAVTYEMARILEADDGQVAQVTLADPPMIFDRSSYPATLTAWLAELAPSAPREYIAEMVDASTELPLSQRIAEVRRQLLRYTSVAEQLLVSRQIEVLLVNYEALSSWHPEGAIAHMDIVLSSATHDSGLHETELWRPYSRSPGRVEVVPGDHFSMLTGVGAIRFADVLVDLAGEDGGACSPDVASPVP